MEGDTSGSGASGPALERPPARRREAGAGEGPPLAVDLRGGPCLRPEARGPGCSSPLLLLILPIRGRARPLLCLSALILLLPLIRLVSSYLALHPKT